MEECDGKVPSLWLVYGIKEANAGKLDGHWFFMNGLCKDLQPKYCMNIDCGTELTTNYLYKCIALAESNPKIGAISSEI